VLLNLQNIFQRLGDVLTHTRGKDLEDFYLPDTLQNYNYFSIDLKFVNLYLIYELIVEKLTRNAIRAAWSVVSIFCRIG
jgi:hypothetical protein